MATKTITTEEARHIASNPDGCCEEDVRALAVYIGPGVRPMAQSAALFPNEVVEAIPGYVPTAPMGRLYVTKCLRNYCWNKCTAMSLRAKGEVAKALTYENICERIYKSLPEWARW